MIDNSQWLELQKNLGPRGRLGVAARFFAANGEVRHEVRFNADELFPMASTAKIAIAMLAASRVHSGECSLEEELRIEPRFLAPGLARSPLDHLFYLPFEISRTETLGRLLGFMIQQSDNTSSDTLLHRFGGPAGVTAFIEELGIREIRLKRTFREIVTSYYGLNLPAGRRPGIAQITASIRQLMDPFTCRDIPEEEFIRAGDDCCTPRAMADLLAVLAKDPKYATAYSQMELCSGGKNRIRKGLEEHMHRIETFGHKTGSLGGVANDAGVVKFADGSFAAVCIMTRQSSAPMEIRDKQIASAARLIVSS